MAPVTRKEIEAQIEKILLEVAKSKKIKNYRLEPSFEMSFGDGFISNFYRGDIIDETTKEVLHVAIKKAPTWDFDYKTFFKNEATFYTNILPVLKKRYEYAFNEPFDVTPKYLASSLEQNNQFIAMEHLKPQGYVMYDKHAYLDRNHLELICKTYGKFHGITFALREQDPEVFRNMHDGLVDGFDSFLDKGRKQFATCAEAAIESLDSESDVFGEVEHLTQLFESSLFKKAFTYDGEHKCSTHGDCWSNNFLFKYSDSGTLEDVKVIDFQLVRVSTPVHDLSYFFYSGAGKQDLDDLEYYLKIYHDSLSETIVRLGEKPENILPFDVFVREWKANALLGVILGLALWQMKLMPKHEIDSIFAQKPLENETPEEMKAKLRKKFVDLRSEILRGDLYRERARNLLTHAVEYGVLSKEKLLVDSENVIS